MMEYWDEDDWEDGPSPEQASESLGMDALAGTLEVQTHDTARDQANRELLASFCQESGLSGASMFESHDIQAIASKKGPSQASGPSSTSVPP